MTVAIDHKGLRETISGPARYQMLIDGKFVDGVEGLRKSRFSPGHGVEVSAYSIGGPADAERAIAAARTAFDVGPWPKMKASQRAAVLLKVADLIDLNRAEIARLDAIEGGKPISQAIGEITGAADIWRYAASLARTLHGESYANLGDDLLAMVLREPVGVVSIITPWNFPFLIVSQKLPFALAAGCTAVVKPSEFTSASTIYLGRLLMDAGLPPGVVNILLGPGSKVGAVMTSHPQVDMVSFTGSTGIGQATMRAAAAGMKKLSMELGGKNAQIVFPDADFEAAVDAAVFGAFFNAGECCNAGSRLILHRDIEKDFLAAFDEKASRLRVGDPLDPATKIGAIISPEHRASIADAVSVAEREGASVFRDGRNLRFDAGQYLGPTVVTNVSPDMAIAREEIFGPVLSVLRFETVEQARELANASEFGLSAGVWSRDIDNCLSVARGVRAGTIWVNTFMDGHPELPFGGYKQSGLGRELGKAAAEDYTELKTIQLHQGARTNWWAS